MVLVQPPSKETEKTSAIGGSKSQEDIAKELGDSFYLLPLLENFMVLETVGTLSVAGSFSFICAVDIFAYACNGCKIILCAKPNYSALLNQYKLGTPRRGVCLGCFSYPSMYKRR